MERMLHVLFGSAAGLTGARMRRDRRMHGHVAIALGNLVNISCLRVSQLTCSVPVVVSASVISNTDMSGTQVTICWQAHAGARLSRLQQYECL